MVMTKKKRRKKENLFISQVSCVTLFLAVSFSLMESEDGVDPRIKSYFFSCKANAHPVVSQHFIYLHTSQKEAILPTLSSLNWKTLIHQELF